MRWILAPSLLLLLAPVAAAQDTVPGTYPTGTGLYDADESVESGPGFAYGGFLLVGVLAFAGVLGYVMWKQKRNPPSGPRR